MGEVLQFPRVKQPTEALNALQIAVGSGIIWEPVASSPPAIEDQFPMLVLVAPLVEATVVPDQPSSKPEVYAQSLRNMRVMGSLALKGAEASAEYIGAEQEIWSDFIHAVGENLATDPVYGEKLKFDPMNSYKMRDGHAIDRAGMPIIELVRAGRLSSKKAAETIPEMAIQEERDEGDELVAEIVDSLGIGEMYAVISMEPKEQIKRNPKLWTSEPFFYRDGLAVAQVYYRASEGTLLAGAYSMKHSNLDAARRMFARRDVIIPEGESPNRWSRYGIRATVNEETARGFGSTLVEEHAREISGKLPQYAVTKFLQDNQHTVRQYFDAYVKPLTAACGSGSNNDAMSSLAGTVLDRVHKLDSDETQQLMSIRHSSTFTDADTRFMEKFVRYGLIEELRSRLPALFKTPQPRRFAGAPHVEPTYFIPVPAQVFASYELLNRRVAVHINAGYEAGRSYGGCSGVGKNRLYDNPLDFLGQLERESLGLQDIFGGKLGEPTGASEATDKYGSLTFVCDDGHTNTREKNELKETCDHCGKSVRCEAK